MLLWPFIDLGYEVHEQDPGLIYSGCYHSFFDWWKVPQLNWS